MLDLSPIPDGADASTALANTLALAQHVEQFDYTRYWLAEHHNMQGIASAATAVVIGHVAGGTSRIRVGAGGVMLPNHAPLMVAEQFGTLESLFPGRIDLGLGRAPGTDPGTAYALRRNLSADVDQFPQDVVELLRYFDGSDQLRVQAVPGHGLKVPVWILGSSLFGASLAAALGLPYAFASHFAPAAMKEAIALYRERFKPSAHADKPHVMLGFNIYVADTEDEARYIRTSSQQAFVNLRTGRPGKLPPPDRNFESKLDAPARQMLNQISHCSAVGTPQQAKTQFDAFVAETQADEVMLVSQVFDLDARKRCYTLAADW